MNGSRPGYSSEPSWGEMRDVSDVAEVVFMNEIVNMVRYFVKNLTCLYNISKNDFLSCIIKA